MNFSDVGNFIKDTYIKPSPQEEYQESKVVAVPPEERKILYRWEAQARPELRQMSQKKMKTLMIVAGAICVLLIAMQEFFLILGVLSLVFVKYMLSQSPSENVTYEITNHGIKFDTLFYEWEKMRYFFMIHADGLEVVGIDLIDTVPARLYITINPSDKDKIKDLLDPYVYYLEEEPKTFIDRAYDSVMDKLDLETDPELRPSKKVLDDKASQ